MDEAGITIAPMSAALAQAVAAEIRAESGRQRVSGRELARRINEPVTTVSRWLRGDTPVGLDELDKIAAALEVDVIDLIRTAQLQLMAKKLPRKDSNLQPAGCRDDQVRGGFAAVARWGFRSARTRRGHRFANRSTLGRTAEVTDRAFDPFSGESDRTAA